MSDQHSAGTYVEFGQVKLYRCITKEFRQEQVYDASRTDLLYSKYVIRVSGFLHGHADWSYLMQYPPSSQGATSAHKGVRYQLLPRQRFRMVVGAVGNDIPGSVIMDVSPAPANMTPPPGSASKPANINLYNLDLRNGPKCNEFIVSRVTGDESFAVDAEFEIYKLECNADGTCPYNTYGVLSNRWAVHESYNVNVQTTRTYTGTTVLASANINAMQLRWIVAPPLQPLFRRDRMEFNISTDGLTLDWTIVDQEIAYSAPYPATKWSYTHTESANGAQMGVSTINVTLEGRSDVNKGELTELAIYIITQKMFNKLPNQLAQLDKTYIVESIDFTDHGGDVNVIVASARVRKQLDAANGMFAAIAQFGLPIKAEHLPAPNNGGNGGLGSSNVLDQNGNVTGTRETGGGLLYDPSLSWGGYGGQIPTVEGPAKIVGIFACFLQNPCDNNHKLVQPSQTIPSYNSSQQSDNPRVPYTATVGTAVATTSDGLYSASMLAASYQHWQVDNVYKRRSMTAAMPIAGTPATSYSATTSFISLAPAQQIRILRVHGERVGDWPEFFDPGNIPTWPVPSSPPAGYAPIVQTYLTHRLRPGTPTYTPTGQPVYRATMEIIIGLSRAPTPAEALALGTDKWNSIGQVVTNANLTNSSW